MHRAAVWQHRCNSNIKIVHNSIEHFLWNPSDFFSDDVLSCLWIVFTNSVFQVPPQKIVRRVEILGIGWPGVIGLTWNESVPWEVMPEVFKCSVRKNEAPTHFKPPPCTDHLNTSGITSHGTDSLHVKPITPGHPIPKISTNLTVFWGGTWKTVCENNPQTREDIIRKEIIRTAQEMLSRVVDNFIVWVAAVLSYSSAVHGTNRVLITEKI